MIIPDWPAPKKIKALITTKMGGFSSGAYSSMNLAQHVGDDAPTVKKNRAKLASQVGFDIFFPRQVHGTDIITLDNENTNLFQSDQTAGDAVYTQTAGVVCAVQTADCLPILICDLNGDELASVHAGWRGLEKGVLSNAIKQFSVPANRLLIYFGPAISQPYFEVGSEVIDAFEVAAKKRKWHPSGLKSVEPLTYKKGKYRLNIYALAKAECLALGVSEANIFGGEYCTYDDSTRFYSYRRDGNCGRMASLIWRSS